MIIFNAHRPYIHGFSSKKGLFLMLTLVIYCLWIRYIRLPRHNSRTLELNNFSTWSLF